MADRIITAGGKGWVAMFEGTVPPEVLSQTDDVIRAAIAASFSVSVPLLGNLKASSIRLVKLGVDGKPLSSGPTSHL